VWRLLTTSDSCDNPLETQTISAVSPPCFDPKNIIATIYQSYPFLDPKKLRCISPPSKFIFWESYGSAPYSVGSYLESIGRPRGWLQCTWKGCWSSPHPDEIPLKYLWYHQYFSMSTMQPSKCHFPPPSLCRTKKTATKGHRITLKAGHNGC
jgi:hypothetical protein